MKLKRAVGLVIVGAVLLFVTASYVQYSDYSGSLRDRGAWSVELAGAVYLTGGTLSVSISTFRVQYDSSPEIPSFGQYLGDKFSGSEKQGDVPVDSTFVELRVIVTVKGEGGFEDTLLDKTTNIPYTWAGGTYGENGVIGSFDYSLGPYVAYYEFSPLKITAKAVVPNQQTLTALYLSIPKPAEVTDG
jgi:hypothetical protein